MEYVRNAEGVTLSVNTVCADKALCFSQNKRSDRMLTATHIKSN